MSAHLQHRQELIAQLAWQVDAGADEALFDQPTADMPAQSIKAFLQPDPNSADLAPRAVAAAPQGLTSPSACEPPRQSSSDGQNPANPDTAIAANIDLASIASLADLRVALEKFDGCALKHTASNLVFADGNPGARVMLVGEAPGRDEDRVGLPFVGASGQLLDKMLASIGLDRATVYIANLLPWRPPGNRTPTSEETTMMLPWLRRHIQLANPDMLFILGGASAKALLGTSDGILKIRGRWQNVDYGDGVPRPTLASLHPAYLLRLPAQKKLAFTDLLTLSARLKE